MLNECCGVELDRLNGSARLKRVESGVLHQWLVKRVEMTDTVFFGM